ncbi:helix-turn-helix domain-containing protein [Hymenobacter sp. DH14]|uniref:Helix-turn-helix domain-containing protein n=1 Tax=Hymenobacter cyanobacteriorum TaxID=2926463 RepID=A0A9X2AIX3_9BACT|nr:helix-turn-helix domain-containing protein [Hymenobacter cyanobacteriorum]MCI1189145.1 helix-turn-helix domain-containing protein [Hymenobacter cyanobacteriorum]
MSNPVAATAAEVNTADLKLKGFKAYPVDTAVNPVPTYARRDFYKVALLTGHSILHYADKSIELSGTCLFFANPHIPYSTELLSTRQTGYACLFTEEFIRAPDRSESLQHSPLFQIGSTPVFKLSNEQAVYITGIFEKILAEQGADYHFKNDLIHTYLQLLIHEALRMQPTETFFQHKNASSRITSLFLELLERLFPVESPQQALPLKSAQDFADRLAIHVNHLNRAVKEVTGKPTTSHIADRIIGEAKALLHHTNWDVAEIAQSLGFEYASYFNNFFKKHTGSTPLAFRKAG